MQPRIDTARVSQDAYKAMLGLQSYVNSQRSGTSSCMNW